MTSLEQAIPVYDFRERHQRWIHADPDRIWQSLTLDELAVTRPLMAIRHAGRRSSAPSKPLFTDGPVRMLEIASPAYAVGGAITRAWQLRPARHEVTSLEEFIDFDEPGWIKFLTDFQLQPGDAGTQLSTETRGQATDKSARRLFAPYWAVIRPASGLVRREILATVARRAEAGPSRT